MHADQVISAWQRRGRLSDLRTISGRWAVALWDPSSHEHLLVTDPLGVQPLFWARTSSGSIAAASWLAQLVDRPDVDDSLDYEGILLDQGWGFTGPSVAHRTRFAAVSRVPWGCALRIRPDGTTRLERYWDPAELPGPDESLTLADSAELLRERIDEAVRRLTPADVPVGAHVSGGLDCTAVACRANQLLQETDGGLVSGYSWAPSEQNVPRFPGDEREILEDISGAEGFPIRTVHPDESGDWFWGLDPNRYPESSHLREAWALPQAREDGVRVMLSGWGGDEFASFNGRAVVRSLLARGRVRTVWSDSAKRLEVALGQRPTVARRARGFAGAMLGVMPERVQDLRDRDLARTMRIKAAEIDEAVRVFSPAAADLRLAAEREYASVRDHHEMQLHLLRLGHLQHRTGAWYQTGRLMGIEYRYPLLDLGVVEAALSLPWWAFRSEGWTRVAYRMAVAPWVPDSVAWNTAKYEPALFWPPQTNPVLRSSPQRKWATDDPRYAEVMQLVGITWDTGGPSISSDARVTAQPHLAPKM